MSCLLCWQSHRWCNAKDRSNQAMIHQSNTMIDVWDLHLWRCCLLNLPFKSAEIIFSSCLRQSMGRRVALLHRREGNDWTELFIACRVLRKNERTDKKMACCYGDSDGFSIQERDTCNLLIMKTFACTQADTPKRLNCSHPCKYETQTAFSLSILNFHQFWWNYSGIYFIYDDALVWKSSETLHSPN